MLLLLCSATGLRTAALRCHVVQSRRTKAPWRDGSLTHPEEQRDAEELERHPGRRLAAVVLWEAVLQGRRQRDESHGADEGILVDENLEHEEKKNMKRKIYEKKT